MHSVGSEYRERAAFVSRTGGVGQGLGFRLSIFDSAFQRSRYDFRSGFLLLFGLRLHFLTSTASAFRSMDRSMARRADLNARQSNRMSRRVCSPAFTARYVSASRHLVPVFHVQVSVFKLFLFPFSFLVSYFKFLSVWA